MHFSFFIKTFGCKVSQYESQPCREYWQRLGGVENKRVENSDVVLVASCAVTAEAVSDARQFWPIFGLGADILMGFSGETEAKLDETLQIAQALPLSDAKARRLA